MFVYLFVGLFASILKNYSKNVLSSERVYFVTLSEPIILCLVLLLLTIFLASVSRTLAWCSVSVESDSGSWSLLSSQGSLRSGDRHNSDLRDSHEYKQEDTYQLTRQLLFHFHPEE